MARQPPEAARGAALTGRQWYAAGSSERVRTACTGHVLQGPTGLGQGNPRNDQQRYSQISADQPT